MNRLLPRLRDWARSVAVRLAPGGSRRQLARFRFVRWLRRFFLPARPRLAPALPDFNDLAPTDGNAGRVYHWLDFHPHVLAMFPLATTPAEREAFVAWLLGHRDRFRLAAGDIAALACELRDDPTAGVEPLYRRRVDWQRAVPDALSPSGWPRLRAHLGEPLWMPVQWPKPATREPERGVNLLAHFCYPCGLQVAAANAVAAFEAVGWATSCRDVPNRQSTDLPTRRRWLGTHPYPATIALLAPDRLGRNAYFVAGLAERRDVYRIGYWYWELEDAPARWGRQRDWLDEIWAPSRFVGDALRKVMPIPVIDVPPGIAMPRPVAAPRSAFGLPENRYLFLFAFDMSSTSERKNPEGVVSAFRRAFRPSEPVALAIKVSRGWEDPAALARLHAAAEPERIVVVDRVLPPEEFDALLNCCDAFVSLHRSEGFGLTLAEAMALGKPTIATNYSGNLDFMNEGNSLLVHAERTTLRRGSRTYPRGSTWAEPSLEDAAAKMRWVVENPSEAIALGERGRESVRSQLSLEAAGRRMTQRLEAVLRPNAPVAKAGE